MASIPRGVADAESDVAYVRGPDRRIWCLSLETGDVLAYSDDDVEPLVAQRGAVLGFAWSADAADRVDIIAMEKEGGRLVPRWSRRFDLPNWIRTEDGDRFDVEADVEGSTVRITWHASTRYRGGAPPPLEVERDARRDAQQAIRLDLASGELIETHEIAEPVAEPTTDAGLLTELGTVPYRFGSSWVNQPWQTGDAQIVLSRAEDEPGLALRRMAASGEESSIPLSVDTPEAILTPDQSLLFLHEPGSTGWCIFDAGTGELRSTVPFDSGTEAASVVNERIVYLVVTEEGDQRRRYLRSRDLASGMILWSQMIEEQVIEAPAPPPP